MQINEAEKMFQFIENHRQSGSAIDQVWITASSDQSKILEILSDELMNSTVDICVIPDGYTQRLLEGETNSVGATKVVNISEISLSSSAEQFKRVFDVTAALIASAILFAPMLLIAVLIKMESQGPALFKQKRYGIDGKEIEVFKFRSMYVHTDDDVHQATRNDMRVTRLGRILRRTSLDELPQLLNVLVCLLYTSPSPRDATLSRMPSSA